MEESSDRFQSYISNRHGFNFHLHWVFFLFYIIYISYFSFNKFSFIITIIISALFLTSFCYFSYCIVLKSVLEAYTYEKEESYVKELNKAINDVKKKRGG